MSPQPTLGTVKFEKDFSDMTEEELKCARHLVERLSHAIETKRAIKSWCLLGPVDVA